MYNVVCCIVTHCQLTSVCRYRAVNCDRMSTHHMLSVEAQQQKLRYIILDVNLIDDFLSLISCKWLRY